MNPTDMNKMSILVSRFAISFIAASASLTRETSRSINSIVADGLLCRSSAMSGVAAEVLRPTM